MSTALRVLSGTGALPMGPLPHGPLPAAGHPERGAPYEREFSGIRLRRMLSES